MTPGLLSLLFFPSLSFAGAPNGITKDEIVIGSCSALEGPFKQLGVQQTQGAKAYFDYINEERGGVLGRKLRLIAFDDNYDPEKAIECFNLLLKEGMFMGAFFTGSATSAKYVTMAESKKIPMLGFTTGAKFVYDPVKRYVFGMRASFADEAKEAIDHLWNDVGARRIGVLYQFDAMGASGSEGVREALKAHQASAILMSALPKTPEELGPVLANMRAAKPDAIVMIASYVEAGKAAQKIKAAGWDPLIVGIGSRDNFIKAAGEAAKGVILTQVLPSPAESGLPGPLLFRQVLSKYSPAADPASYFALEGFLEAKLLAEAIRLAGKDIDREKLVEAFESMRDFDLGLGPEMKIGYARGRHGALKKIYFTIVRDGRAVPLRSWEPLRISPAGGY